MTDLSLRESLNEYILKRDFKATFNFIKQLKKQWSRKIKAIKFTKVALEKLKHRDQTYRDQDQQTVGLSIEVSAAPSNLKVYYAEWSNIVIDKNGK